MWLSWLRIWCHCSSLSCYHSMGSIPDPGTSTCLGHGQTFFFEGVLKLFSIPLHHFTHPPTMYECCSLAFFRQIPAFLAISITFQPYLSERTPCFSRVIGIPCSRSPKILVFLFVFLMFAGLHPWPMEGPRLGVLQLRAYTTPTAMPDPSCI